MASGKELLEKIEAMTQKRDRELADSVLEVSVKANWDLVEELNGDARIRRLKMTYYQ